MRHLKVLEIGCAVVLAHCAAPIGAAAPVMMQFSGHVISVDDPNGVLDLSVVPRAAITGSLEFDPAIAVDSNPGNPFLGSYGFEEPISVIIGKMVVDSGRSRITVQNGPQDGISVFDGPFSDIGVDDLVLSVTLTDVSGSAIDSKEVPVLIDLASFPDMRRFLLQENILGMRIEGEITSITFIPEPSATLCLLGLGAPLLQRRRREGW